jgi:hypothetical protein
MPFRTPWTGSRTAAVRHLLGASSGSELIDLGGIESDLVNRAVADRTTVT